MESSTFDIYVTIAGQSILNKLLAGDNIYLTRAVMSSQEPEFPEEAITLNEALEATQIALTDHGNYTEIEIAFQLKNLESDLDFRSIGIYGRTNTTSEKLIYVALVSEESQMTIPAGSPINYVVTLKETLAQGQLQVETAPSYATPISHNSDFRRHIFSQTNNDTAIALVNSGVDETFANGDSIVFVPKVDMNTGAEIQIASQNYILTYADIQGNALQTGVFKAHKPYGLYFYNNTFVYKEEEIVVRNGELLFWVGSEYKQAQAVGSLQVKNGILHYYSSGAWHSTMPAGLINAFDLTTAPAGYLLCNGASVSKNTYPELFSAIGYRHGGSGNNFNLPDLRGKMILGVNSSHAIGTFGGKEKQNIQINNLPAHHHSVSGTISYEGHKSSNLVAGEDYIGINSSLGGMSLLDYQYAQTTVPKEAVFSATSADTGSGSALEILNPYLSVNYFISTGKSLIS